jgi:hypothetical protein
MMLALLFRTVNTHTNLIIQNNKASYIVNNKYFAELMYSTKRTRKYCVSYTVRACPRLFFVSNCGLTRATVRNWLNSLWLVLSALEERWLVRSRTYSLFLRLCFWKVVKYLGRQVTFPYPSGHCQLRTLILDKIQIVAMPVYLCVAVGWVGIIHGI